MILANIFIDVKFDNLFKMVSARFLLCKGTSHGIYNLLANICQVLTVLQLWLDAVVEVKVVKVICSVVSDSLQPHGL